MRHQVSWQDLIGRVRSLATMQTLSHNPVNRFLGSTFKKAPDSRVKGESALSYVDQIELIRQEGIIVISLSDGHESIKWADQALSFTEIEHIEPRSSFEGPEASAGCDRHENYRVTINGKRVIFGLEEKDQISRLAKIIICLGHTVPRERTIRITGNPARFIRQAKQIFGQLSDLFRLDERPSIFNQEDNSDDKRYDWLIRAAKEKGRIEGFRTIVVEPSGTITFHDFWLTRKACRYADDAVAEHGDNPPIAIVLDRSFSVIHVGKPYFA